MTRTGNRSSSSTGANGILVFAAFIFELRLQWPAVETGGIVLLAVLLAVAVIRIMGAIFKAALKLADLCCFIFGAYLYLHGKGLVRHGYNRLLGMVVFREPA